MKLEQNEFDELLTRNFPICKITSKTRLRRLSLPVGVTIYLKKFDSKSKTPVEPDLLSEATGGISPIPRVTEERKWRPTVETDAVFLIEWMNLSNSQ